jgi:hypothetical protein
MKARKQLDATEGRSILEKLPTKTERIEAEMFPVEKKTYSTDGLPDREKLLAIQAVNNMAFDRATTLHEIERIRSHAEEIVKTARDESVQWEAAYVRSMAEKLIQARQTGDLDQSVNYALHLMRLYMKLILRRHESNVELGRETRESKREAIRERWEPTAPQREDRNQQMRSVAERMRTAGKSEQSIAVHLKKSEYNNPPIKVRQILQIIKKSAPTS